MEDGHRPIGAVVVGHRGCGEAEPLVEGDGAGVDRAGDRAQFPTSPIRRLLGDSRVTRDPLVRHVNASRDELRANGEAGLAVAGPGSPLLASMKQVPRPRRTLLLERKSSHEVLALAECVRERSASACLQSLRRESARRTRRL